MIAGGGCEAAVTARTTCGRVKFRECGELMYGRRFPLWLKGTVYELCKDINTVWKRSMVPERYVNLQRTEIFVVRAMCGLLLLDRNTSKDLMLMWV